MISTIEQGDLEKQQTPMERFSLLLTESTMFAVSYLESLVFKRKEISFMKEGESLYFNPWDIEVNHDGEYFIRKNIKGYSQRGGMFCIEVKNINNVFIIVSDKSDQYAVNALKRLSELVSEYDNKDCITLGIIS